jgi:hypothetical protein
MFINNNLFIFTIMTEIDFISKLLYTDKNNSYSVLTYIDIDGVLSNDFIIDYINKIVKNNPVLKQTIIKKYNLFFLQDVKSFIIDDYYTIEYIKQEYFNNYISDMLNKNFETEIKWKFLFCIDKENKKTRFYFKIHHAYVDGYKIIDILTIPLTDKGKYENITNKFKRNVKTDNLNKIYYYVIGTFILIILNMIILFDFLNPFKTKIDNEKFYEEKTDYIICKSLNLSEIKTYTKKNDITITTFLSALTVKTDKLYRNKEKIITICSPYYIQGVKYINNMLPVFNRINNSCDNFTLFKKINNTLNNYKYSLFIKILTFIKYILNSLVSYINIEILVKIIRENTFDYAFSCMIGPSIKEIDLVKILDIHYLDNTINKEIMYNIISSGNNVNIICSFKEGIIEDKARFEKCIYEAYASLMCV